MAQAQSAPISAPDDETDFFDASRSFELRRRSAPGGLRLHMIGARVLVRRIREEQSPGGIVLADDSQAHATMGEVIAAGHECELLKVGDVVLFGRFSGDPVAPSTTLDIAGGFKDVVVMMEEDVMGVFSELKE